MPGKRGAPYGNRNAAGPHGGRQGPAKIKLPSALISYNKRDRGWRIRNGFTVRERKKR